MFRIARFVAIAVVQVTMGFALLACRSTFAQERTPSPPAPAASSATHVADPPSDRPIPSKKGKKAKKTKARKASQTSTGFPSPPNQAPTSADQPIRAEGREGECFERALDRFPWPKVPRPTNQRVIVKDYLKSTDPSEGPSADQLAGRYPDGPRKLGQLLVLLRHRLVMAGYPAPPVLGAGCNGFALILEGERIRLDGTRIGFEQWNQGKRLGLIEILEKLMQGQPGFFRMIVLVASNERPVEGGDPITAEELRRMLMLGASGLPVGMQDIPFDGKYELYALVYEFETGTKDSPAQIAPTGRIPILSHLRAAGLVAAN
jgi:hypothetical protein